MNSPASPLVVKVGGSLFDRVVPLLDLFREAGRPVLIVPGGGKFADLVRRLDVSEDAAHWMAIAGMEQFAWYIASHGIPATSALALPAEATVLLPYCALREADPLSHSWDVTSDTIAAWVARELSADLLLLKSVDGIHHHRKLIARVGDPDLVSDEVDPAFIRFVFDHDLRARVVNGRHDERVRSALRGEPVVGTLVDPRF
ncbi:uridylate kinase [Methanoculleus chikugoensis]|uniref:Amino acid kinase n=1 Tax=Methanoculleus chikugoensis TaxID=118126 RepID=A0ABN5XDE9_9EURY|nr:uridylate kinase [Methanoculleus chikugoensis]BBL66976.1 amino acid kinase [Methanoculleus chikugoensis]